MSDFYKVTASSFALSFYSVYALLFSCGYIFIDWELMSFTTFSLCLIFSSSIIFFIKCGESLYLDVRSQILTISVSKFLLIFYLIMLISISFSWYKCAEYWGGIEYVFLHANEIRESVIGVEIDGYIPFYVGYLNSLNHALFSLSIVFFIKTKSSKKIAATFSFLYFINIVLADLLSFGRIGTLYALFMIISIVFVVSGFSIFKLRNICIVIILFFILNIPRMIRGGGDNFEETMSGINNYLLIKFPSWMNGVISNYIYFFSSPIALSHYLDGEIDKTTYGQRLFTPIYNVIYRIFGIEKINTIDSFVSIPYQTNVYTILKDIISDLGVGGVLIYCMFLGVLIGALSNAKNSISSAMYCMMLAYIMYTPLYNPFSFGMFVISFLFLAILFFLIRFDLE